jgi:serine/threonine-protein kinase RsbW
MAAGVEVKLVLPSEIKLVDVVHEAAERVAQLAGFDGEESLNVGLAVREAVINAILHGNRGDQSLKVRVTLSTGRNGLKAKIRDQGNGFEPERAPDPTAAANLMRTSGRGLLLMRAFVDDVTFRHAAGGGTEVTLTKRRQPSPDGVLVAKTESRPDSTEERG